MPCRLLIPLVRTIIKNRPKQAEEETSAESSKDTAGGTLEKMLEAIRKEASKDTRNSSEG